MFTKSEMLEELREIVFDYIRATSYALDQNAGCRLMQWERQAPIADAHELMRPETCASDFASFSINGLPVTNTVEQFYDYGLAGTRNFEIDLVIGATEWTFAYGFIRDASTSFLISESRNGAPAKATKCLHAARAFFARLVLDGGERIFWEDGEWGEGAPRGDVLTLAEVALLAVLDERTVRNATSKSTVNRLNTVVIGSNIYIPREAAIAWLTTKRGFTPTRVGNNLLPDAVLDNPFVGFAEAGEFVRSGRERLRLTPDQLLTKMNSILSKTDLDALEAGRICVDESVLTNLGDALGFNGQLFALRLLEVQYKHSLNALQYRIQSIN